MNISSLITDIILSDQKIRKKSNMQIINSAMGVQTLLVVFQVTETVITSLASVLVLPPITKMKQA